ncbi:hypothetical protein, partial [Aeromonas jandaei]|uniref:hypothetical protein n=3 Tax=Aeromonadaceae TaxID=84642 RepID=UPI002B06150C
SILYELSKNTNCPEEVLIKLSKNKDPIYRQGIASNTNTPISILAVLASDSNINVRSGVVSNQNCPLDIKIKLACDDNVEFVRFTARSALERMSHGDWEAAILEGYSLSYSNPACESDEKKLGDMLLSSGLVDVYQTIQSVELSNRLASKEPPPISLASQSTIKMRL